MESTLYLVLSLGGIRPKQRTKLVALGNANRHVCPEVSTNLAQMLNHTVKQPRLPGRSTPPRLNGNVRDVHVEVEVPNRLVGVFARGYEGW